MEGDGVGAGSNAIDGKAQHPLRTRETGAGAFVPKNFCNALKLEQVARFKIEKKIGALRVLEQITQGIEHVISRVIGIFDGPLVHNSDKAGFAAAMGHVHPK